MLGWKASAYWMNLDECGTVTCDGVYWALRKGQSAALLVAAPERGRYGRERQTRPCHYTMS